MLDVYIVSSPKMTLELKFSVSPMLECSLCPDQKREAAESTGQSGNRLCWMCTLCPALKWPWNRNFLFHHCQLLECSLCPGQKREGTESTGQSAERMLRVQV